MTNEGMMTPEQQRELRNQIFATKQLIEGSGGNGTNPQQQQLISRVDAARQELGLEIPTAFVPLPSKGLIYPVGSALHGKEEVEIRQMTSQQEDILTSRALFKKGTVITELVRSCLIDPTINVHELLSGDRNALMIAIRITGYGSEYNPEVTCPEEECKTKQKAEINLSDLEVKFLTIDPITPGTNRFAFQLPVTKKRIEFKFLTGRE